VAQKFKTHLAPVVTELDVCPSIDLRRSSALDLPRNNRQGQQRSGSSTRHSRKMLVASAQVQTIAGLGRHALTHRSALLLSPCQMSGSLRRYHGSVQVAIRAKKRSSEGGEHFHLSIQGEGYATVTSSKLAFPICRGEGMFFCETAWRRYLEVILYAVKCIPLCRRQKR